MHIPAEYHTAETKAVFCYLEELVLGHQLAAEDAVDVAAGDFDGVVIFEDVGEVFEGYFDFRHLVRVCDDWKVVETESCLRATGADTRSSMLYPTL